MSVVGETQMTIKTKEQMKDELKFWSNFIKNLNAIPDIANLREDCPDASFFHSQGYNKLMNDAMNRFKKIRELINSK